MFYFHTLLVYHHTCRLLFMHHCMREARRIYTDPTGLPWFAVEYGGVSLATQWGHEAIVLAEGVLSAILSRSGRDLDFMAAAPDNFFAMICFAASFLVMVKLSAWQNHELDIPGSSNALLAKMIANLVRIACASEHAPAKCAQLIKGLVASFEARTRKSAVMRADESSQHACAPASSRLESGIGMDDQPERGDYIGLDEPMPEMGAFGGLLNSEVMLDSDFWASFMDNFSADVPYTDMRAS